MNDHKFVIYNLSIFDRETFRTIMDTAHQYGKEDITTVKNVYPVFKEGKLVKGDLI